MSKVLVDRELLENCLDAAKDAYAATLLNDLQSVLAQPAGAEGAELKRLAAEFDAAPDDAEWEPTHPIFQMAAEIDRVNAALSAVTAERDRLRAFVTDCTETAGGMVNGNRLSHRAKELIAAMAAKEA